MKRICTGVAAAAAWSSITAFVPGAEAGKGTPVMPAPLCPALTPTIYSVSYSAPAPGQVLGRQSVLYLEGTYLDVTLTLPTCTSVSEVRLGGIALGTSSSGIDAPSSWYQIVSDVGAGSGKHAVKVRFRVPNIGQGASSPARIVVKAASGGATAVHDFTLATVEAVTLALEASVPITRSESEIRNQFLAGLLGRFQTGTYVASSGRELYDLGYEDLDLRVEDDGIHFGFHFKARVGGDWWCDPTIHVDGGFHLDVTGTGVFVEWLDGDGPSVDTSWPFLCAASDLFDGDDEDDAREEIAAVIQGEVDAAVNSCGGGLSCAPYLDAIVTDSEQLTIYAQPPFDSVTIKVPYDASRAKEPGYGLALAPNELVTLLAGGTSTVCVRDYAGWHYPTCEILRTGPNGLFNASTNAPGATFPFGDFLDTFNAVDKFYRTAATLPWPMRNPGALVANLYQANGAPEQKVFAGAGACSLQTTATTAHRLSFGVNDTQEATGQQRGAGWLDVTVAFPPESLGSSGCPTVNTGVTVLDPGLTK